MPGRREDTGVYDLEGSLGLMEKVRIRDQEERMLGESESDLDFSVRGGLVMRFGWRSSGSWE